MLAESGLSPSSTSTVAPASGVTVTVLSSATADTAKVGWALIAPATAVAMASAVGALLMSITIRGVPVLPSPLTSNSNSTVSVPSSTENHVSSCPDSRSTVRRCDSILVEEVTLESGLLPSSKSNVAPEPAVNVSRAPDETADTSKAGAALIALAISAATSSAVVAPLMSITVPRPPTVPSVSSSKKTTSVPSPGTVSVPS